MSTAAESAQPTTAKPKKKRRVFLWFFLAIQILFLVWIITAVNSGGTASDCGSLSQHDCQAAQDAGTGIGVVLLLILWFCVDAFMGLIYGIYRLAKRT